MFTLTLLWEELFSCIDKCAVKLGWKCSSESNLSMINVTEMQNIHKLK